MCVGMHDQGNMGVYIQRCAALTAMPTPTLQSRSRTCGRNKTRKESDEVRWIQTRKMDVKAWECLERKAHQYRLSGESSLQHSVQPSQPCSSCSQPGGASQRVSVVIRFL